MRLIEIRKKDGGQLLAACDARCYRASSRPSACRCACGGANHGAGQDEASATARRFQDRRRLPIGVRREVCHRWRALNLEPRDLRLFFFPIPEQLDLFRE